jgi:SET domain-containing protein
MLLVRTRLAQSSIHNLGLFADQLIPAGTVIWRFNPGYDLDIPLEEMNSQPAYVREFFEHYGYLDFHLNRYILCFDNARFINHSDTPNTRPDYSRETHGVDIAIHDIKEGEEITTDYRLFERLPTSEP